MPEAETNSTTETGTTNTTNATEDKEWQIKHDVHYFWPKILVVCVIVFIAWLFSSYMLIDYYECNLEKAAHRGDTFGAINALFTGLAFAAVVASLWLQRTELRLQRQELEMTRRELKQSRVAQQEQAKILNRTAELEATIALAQYEGKSYAEAVAMYMGTQDLLQRAANYERYVFKLKQFLGDVDPSLPNPSGYAALAVRQGKLPVVEITDPKIFIQEIPEKEGQVRRGLRTTFNLKNITPSALTIDSIECVVIKLGGSYTWVQRSRELERVVLNPGQSLPCRILEENVNLPTHVENLSLAVAVLTFKEINHKFSITFHSGFGYQLGVKEE